MSQKLASLLLLLHLVLRSRNVESLGSGSFTKNVRSSSQTAAPSISSDDFTRQRRAFLLKSSRSSLNNSAKSVEDIEKIYVISDLHTDSDANIDWLKERCKNSNMPQTPTKNDAIIIAGDISHKLWKIEEAFSVILEELSCHVFFICGNHEAWIGNQEMESLGIESSLQKIAAVKDLCKRMGVRTEFELVGDSNKNPAFIIPIESWYDGTLALEGCEDLCTKFHTWPWVDFRRCEWPDQDSLKQQCLSIDEDGFSILDRGVENTGRIPLGLTDWFALKNEIQITEAKTIYNDLLQDNYQRNDKLVETGANKQRLPGLITYSHFLPNQQSLPDWKDPSSDEFLRDEWLNHPVPDVSAKFAKVAGSVLIDEQIRSILNSDVLVNSVQHLHIFGHSHRPKDFVYNGIRYIHNPLGKEKERNMNMISNDVDFKLVWDCTKSVSVPHDDIENISCLGGSGEGEVPGERVIRYWEERGGGIKELEKNLKPRAPRTR
jgi:predicted phosphodiesterase